MSWGEVLDRCLALPSPRHYLTEPPYFPLSADHIPMTPRVIPGEYGPRALAGCLKGMPRRELGLGRGKRRASWPSLSSVGATPLVWGLTEAPDQEAGPHKGEACPNSLSSQGAPGGYCRSSGR